jgi:hypothetical protein
MNKKQAMRIAREVTGVLIQDFMGGWGIRNLVEAKTPEDEKRLWDAFECLRSIVEHPRNANYRPAPRSK